MSKRALTVNSTFIIPLDEIGVSFVRSSGPGGQNVNKVNSRAVIRWNPKSSRVCPPGVRDRFLKRFSSKITSTGEIIISSSESRDQMRNLDLCYQKLKGMILSVLRPPKTRVPSKPSRGAKERRIQSKIKQGRKKALRRRSADD